LFKLRSLKSLSLFYPPFGPVNSETLQFLRPNRMMFFWNLVYSKFVYRGTDSAGNTSTEACSFMPIFDPNGGFVTGGGWIVPGGSTSEPGDFLPGLDNTSNANFGFVVKYQNRASTVQKDNLKFHYNVGSFHLHSSNMDWLVVTNSNWAHFQGMAEIDGMEGLYPFKVDVKDDTVDRFIIKIWAPDANPDIDELIYKASGNLEGGQIKIHK
jgi:hypothetical protein